MTREQIKDKYHMVDILQRYNLKANRAGFIRCHFHTGDNSPSLKIYKDDFHCFSCGAHGDIFSFVQRMENVGFKEAFQILGGIYEKPTFESNLAVYRAKKRKQERQREEQKQKDKRELNNALINAYRWGVEHNAPLSDAWCENYNALQKQLYVHETINETR